MSNIRATKSAQNEKYSVAATTDKVQVWMLRHTSPLKHIDVKWLGGRLVRAPM